MGNGPFVLTDHRVNSVIEVQKNPQYWDSETVKLNAIRFYPIESTDSEERAFRSGFLHLTQTVSPDRIDYLGKASRLNPFRIIFGNLFPIVLMWRNLLLTAAYVLDFNLATDRQAMVEKVTKGDKHCSMLYSSWHRRFLSEDRFLFDPQKATPSSRIILRTRVLIAFPRSS